mgnify:CR=1 FL=1
MEIGSFIELDLRNSGEYYKGELNISRLNSGRAGIYHALRILACNKVYLPYYLCPSVKIFLKKKNIEVIPYFINENFIPNIANQDRNSAIVIVNYFGILSNESLKQNISSFTNIIIDNSAAFFSYPLDDTYCVYSTRKFFGVPDGCYVIGKNAEKLTDQYQQDFSSSTASFLLKRIETGCATNYAERMLNEKRIDNSDILNMSLLTRNLLNNIDYKQIKKKRKDNFYIAHNFYYTINQLNPIKYMDKKNVPMVYPLLVESADLAQELIKKKIYTGRLWNHVLKEINRNTFETKLSRFMIPIPIDQRYGKFEIEYVFKIVEKSLRNKIGN